MISVSFNTLCWHIFLKSFYKNPCPLVFINLHNIWHFVLNSLTSSHREDFLICRKVIQLVCNFTDSFLQYVFGFVVISGHQYIFNAFPNVLFFQWQKWDISCDHVADYDITKVHATWNNNSIKYTFNGFK